MSGSAQIAGTSHLYATFMPSIEALQKFSLAYSPEALKKVVKQCGNRNAAITAAVMAVLIPIIARKRHAVRSSEISNGLKIAPQEQVYTEKSVQVKNSEVAVARAQLPGRAAQAQKQLNKLLYSAYGVAGACGVYALLYGLLSDKSST